MRSWLPEGHLAWRMIGLAGELDLAEITGAYRSDGQGQAPYDPAMMLTLVLYCQYKGIRSSRTIAAACIDDVGCRVICGAARPSHQAVASFRRRHRNPVRRLFVQVLGIMAAEDAIGGHSAAIDGSPVSGNASRFASLTGEQLDAAIAALREQVDAAAAQWLDGNGPGGQDTLRDDDDDDEDDGGLPAGMPRRLAAMTRRLGVLLAAKDTLAGRAAGGADAKAQARVDKARQTAVRAAERLASAAAQASAKTDRYNQYAAAGKPWPYGKIPVPASENKKVARVRKNAVTAAARLAAAEQAAAATAPGKVSATDPGTRLLPAKNGGWVQGWNLQLAAARNQVLLAVELHDNPADTSALVPLIQACQDNLAAAAAWPGAGGVQQQIRAWLADAGFASAANFAELQNLLLLVAVKREAAQAGRSHTGRDTPAGWQDMAARLDTPAGKALYKRRAAQVEPAFAQLFARFGRYFHYRGTDAVDAEAKLLGTVHNIAKLFACRRRREQHQQRRQPTAAPAIA